MKTKLRRRSSQPIFLIYHLHTPEAPTITYSLFDSPLARRQGPAKRRRLAATLLQKAKKEKNASRSKKAEGEEKAKAASEAEAEEDAVDAEILFEFRVKSVPPEIQNLLQSGEIAAAWDSLRGVGGISQVTDVSLKVHESWPSWNQTVFLPAGYFHFL